MYDHLVRRPGSRHQMLARYFDTGNIETDLFRQIDVVRAFSQEYPKLKRLMNMWEVIVRWCVGVVARR